MREHPYECVFGDSMKWEFLRKPSKQASRRQDYDERFYYIDGSIYLASVDFIKENKSLVKPGETYLFQTENRFNIDIDEPEDLEVAQSLMKFRNKTTKYGRK
jgi:CMP-N-acetylneuraminic acid synthetase